MSQSNVFYKNRINPAMEKKLTNDLERIESFFSESKVELELYALKLDINKDEEYIHIVLDEFLDNNPTFINAYFTSENGDDYLDHFRKPEVDGRERSWYKAAKENGFTIVKPYVDVLTNKWVVTLSLPVYRNNAFHGVMGVDFLIDDLVEDISAHSNLSVTSMILINDSDEIIYYDKDFENHEHVRNVLGSENKGLIIKSFELPRLHQSLFIIYDAASYNNNIKKISIEMTIILVFIGMVTIILAFSSSNKISLPLSEFKDAIHYVDETHSTYAPGHDINQWNDEFRKLFEKFTLLAQKFEIDKKRLIERYDLLTNTNQQLLDKNIELENLFKNQKLLDKRIRKSQKDYQSILNNINGMVWVLNSKGEIVFVNDLLNEALAYQEDELIGETIDYIVQNNYHNVLSFFNMLSSRDFSKIELNLKDANNNLVQVEASIARIFDQDELIYVYGICRDISAHKTLHYNFNVKIQEQNLIMELTETASMNMSLNQVTRSVFSKLNVIFGWSAATIRFLNENNQFELISSTTQGQEFVVNTALNYEHSCLGYTLDKNQIQYVYEIDQLPVVEPIYSSMLESDYAIVFIPVGTKEIGRGVITIAVEKSTLMEKEETLKAFTNTIIIVVERALIYEKLKKDYIRMIKVLAEAGDDKDSSSIGHSNRIADICKKIGEHMYLDDDEIVDLEVSGLLHDIGKIGISDQYLSADAKKTEKGQEMLEAHPVIGRKMLEDIGLSDNILDGILMHHVNFDLTGYPKVSNIDVIPLFARIIRVADQFDNLKQSNMFVTSKDIWFEMAMHSGSLYCPQVMKVLKEVIDKKLL